MFGVIDVAHVTLKSTFMTNVNIESYAYQDGVDFGGFGRVYEGEHNGQQVALKILDKKVGTFSHCCTPNINIGSFWKGACKKDFCREALAWRSLVHKFILPLAGIFAEKSQLFLVLPFMTNGTLSEWRKNQLSLVIPDVHTMVRSQCASEIYKWNDFYPLDAWGCWRCSIYSLRRNCTQWFAWSACFHHTSSIISFLLLLGQYFSRSRSPLPNCWFWISTTFRWHC